MSLLSYLLSFLAAFSLSFLLTIFVKRFSIRLKILDRPLSGQSERKIHAKPIPLLGGMAVWGGFFAVIFYLAYFTDFLVGKNIFLSHIWILFGASSLLMLGGYLDDRYSLRPGRQIIWPLAASLLVAVGGIGPKIVTNPLGGVFQLDGWQWAIGDQRIIYPAVALLTFIWLLGMMYTTKLLDGLDGLVGGITVIGSLVIFFLSISAKYFQPDTALMAIVAAGAALGFLIFNFHPAKIFLGEGGALFCGFILGILAIIAGGKIATALLVMGVAILDVIWVIIRRAFFEKKSPFKTADRKHLHFRLLDIGLSHRQAVLFLYFLSAAFGATTLFLQSRQKLMVLGVLVVVTAGLGAWLVGRYRNAGGR